MFEAVLRMSFSATIIIAALLIFRPLLKKLPSGMRAALWIMVAIRLICPVFMESSFSLVPKDAVIDRGDKVIAETPYVPEVITPDSSDGLTVVIPSLPATDTPEVKPVEKTSTMGLASKVWLLGMAAMAAYFILEYVRLKRRVAASVAGDGGIRLCDDINTAFIVGVVKPVIYLPSHLDGEYRDMIICHERTHVSRYDHLQKLFGYTLLTLHWFNPFAWVAYVLFCKDIELACDERVIKNRSDSFKKQYATALLYGCASKGGISPCRVAFGEIGVTQRIKNVLKYKKVKLWLLVIGVALAVALGVCFLTNPKGEDRPEESTDESSAEASSEELAENSSPDLSADTEYSADNSNDASVDASVDISNDASVDESDDVSTAPPEDNSSEDVQAKSVEWYSVQSSHETSEKYTGIKSIYGTYSENRYLAPVIIRKYAYDKNGPYSMELKGQRIKVWLCDKHGNKIDYVYSNTHGIALFEVFAGEYTVTAETVDGFLQAQTSSYLSYFKAGTRLDTDLVFFELNEINTTEISMYDDKFYKAVTLSVIDSVTKQPVPSAVVYVDNWYKAVDSSGNIKVIVKKGDTRALQARSDGYTSVSVEPDAATDCTVAELEPLS